MTAEKLNKHIWEGWTVQDFIDELEPTLDRMQTTDFSCLPYIKNRAQLKAHCMSNQPYYKKYIKEVVDYFAEKYNIK
jgi:hypothetical protein